MSSPESLSNPSEDPRRAVVIGSGFGGLALAVRLQAAGLQVTLLEKREKLGGRAYHLEDRGYVFDMGPSLITAPHIIDAVFQAAGRRMEDYLELMPLDPYYRIYFHDGTHIDYVGDPDRMKAQMATFNERDAERFDDFMAKVRPIYDEVIGNRLGSKNFGSLKTMVGFIPKMIKLDAYRPVAQFVNRYFEDFRHRFIYSFHPLFVGGNPFHTPSVYLMIPYLERRGGVWFSRGGMYSLVEALGTLFRELGGEILTEHEVTRIGVEGGRATHVEAGGRRFEADLVVSNGDVGHTYRDLIASEHRKKWTDRKVAKIDYSMSCFLLYLGTRKQYPALEHHTLILTERYRDLLEDIFEKKILPDDFSMYLHVPTRTDPSMAPEGCESMYVLVPVANLGSGLDWEELREPFADTVIDFLEDWGLEGLRENLEVCHLMDPRDFRDELNSTLGNAFAVVPKFTQTAWFRPHNRSEDVDGLYLVGAGTHPGAGVPGVFLSAETTYGCIAEDLGLADQWDWDEQGKVELDPHRARHDAAEAVPPVAPTSGVPSGPPRTG
ncbi:MAG: phytoene desaturase [Gemmatimonadales bacterium]|nr:MAG: phytoene desaturase [Gemmatimonadales bacterium]